MNTEHIQKSDPYTGEKFIPSRSNQRFACRENQIRYNNEKARKRRQAKREFDRPLEINRRVLERILGNKTEAQVSLDFLKGAGFDFRYFTQSIRKSGKVYQCVYHFSLRVLDDNQVLITKWKADA